MTPSSPPDAMTLPMKIKVKMITIMVESGVGRKGKVLLGGKRRDGFL